MLFSLRLLVQDQRPVEVVRAHRLVQQVLLVLLVLLVEGLQEVFLLFKAFLVTFEVVVLYGRVLLKVFVRLRSFRVLKGRFAEDVLFLG